MNILYEKTRLFGRMFKGGGGEGGSSNTESSNNNDSGSGNYGGYTTGSDSNAQSYSDATQAQESYSSPTASESNGLADNGNYSSYENAGDPGVGASVDTGGGGKGGVPDSSPSTATDTTPSYDLGGKGGNYSVPNMSASGAPVGGEQTPSAPEGSAPIADTPTSTIQADVNTTPAPTPANETTAVDTPAPEPAAPPEAPITRSLVDNTPAPPTDTQADTPAPVTPPADAPGPTPLTNQKPGEDNQAQGQSQETTKITDLAQAAKDSGTPLSSMLGLGLSDSDKMKAGLYGGAAGTEPTWNQLKELQKNGFGTLEGVNPNNLTGQNVDNMIAAGNTSRVLGQVGNLALNVGLNSIPGANFIRPLVNGTIAYNNGMPIGDVLGNAAVDIGSGYLTNDVNKIFNNAIGPDAAKAIGDYNNIGALVNTFSPGTIPGFNAGALTTNFVKDQANNFAKDQGWTTTGWNGLPNGIGITGPDGPISGQTTPDGSAIPDVQPWHGGSNNNSTTAGPLTTTADTTATSNNPFTLPGAYDPEALYKHNLQVYGPIFKKGVTA